MSSVYSRVIATPIGPLTARVDAEGALVSLHFGDDGTSLGGEACDVVARQLDEFFAGRRREFELRLAPAGTAFQLSVWNALAEIPYGTTVSYADLARRIGRPAAVRAVGAANGANPIPIILPCHRVIGSNGSLTGYGGGIEKKEWLLAFENVRLF